MNKNFKLGLAVFAMFLVSAACFAISVKDKQCEGAWVDENGAGFYITKGKVYPIANGVWYDEVQYKSKLKLEIDDDGAIVEKGFFYFDEDDNLVYGVNPTNPERTMEDDPTYYEIESIEGNTMKGVKIHAKAYGFSFKKLSKIPPKSKKNL